MHVMKELLADIYDNERVAKRLLDQEIFGTWTLEQMEAFCSDALFPFAPMMSLGHLEDPTQFLTFALRDLPGQEMDRVNVQLATGLRGWNQDDYKVDTLLLTADFALHADADLTIPVLGNHAETLTDTPDACAELVNIIGGFSNGKEPTNTLLRLYEQDDMHPQMTPNLFMSIVKERPNEFPPFLSRFLSYLPVYQEERRKEFVPLTMKQLVKTVGWPTILRHRDELSDENFELFAQAVGSDTVQREIEKEASRKRD
jgi:hypothetical protein